MTLHPWRKPKQNIQNIEKLTNLALKGEAFSCNMVKLFNINTLQEIASIPLS